MRYLCIDTSGSRTSVGAVNGNKRAYLSDDGFVKASRALMPMIDSALKQVELNIADADFVSVVIGPGSFTGIRIGVSAARALAYALNKPVVSVNSCELAAYNSRKAKEYLPRSTRATALFFPRCTTAKRKSKRRDV